MQRGSKGGPEYINIPNATSGNGGMPEISKRKRRCCTRPAMVLYAMGVLILIIAIISAVTLSDTVRLVLCFSSVVLGVSLIVAGIIFDCIGEL